MLAFDLGASNGRAILGRFDGNVIDSEIIHKFENSAQAVCDEQYWDILRLFGEIKTGIKKTVRKGYCIDSIGVDTWGVDYGFIDAAGKLMANPYFYRDQRTDGLVEEVTKKIPAEKIYALTGIQFMPINTLYQLYADRLRRPWLLDNADSLLFIPDLINYFLTGEKYNEYTIASTSQMLNPVEGKWADLLFRELDIPLEITEDIIRPGEKIGALRTGVGNECKVAGGIPVIATGSHDTASAVAATPMKDKNRSVYISTGTWSLLGMELDAPFINEQARLENFTNECGVENKTRFLKNICGLWLIQEAKKSWAEEGLDLNFSDIEKAAAEAGAAGFAIDPNDCRFLNPKDMPAAIRDYCLETGQPVPQTHGEMARGIYESLAESSAVLIDKLEKMLDKKVENINMVGGGINAELLCRLTADATGKVVLAGPAEATSLGNIIVQLMALGEISNLEEGREIVRRSVKIKEYEPNTP